MQVGDAGKSESHLVVRWIGIQDLPTGRRQGARAGRGSFVPPARGANFLCKVQCLRRCDLTKKNSKTT